MNLNIIDSLKKAGIYLYILILVILAGAAFFSSNYISQNEIKDTLRQLLKAESITPVFTYTFNTALLPVDTEVPNPFRGSYYWQGVTVQPTGWPIFDSYQRYTWNEIEKSVGSYDFSLIDSELSAAKNRGGKFGFRIMAVNSYRGGMSIPQYLADAMSGNPAAGWFVYPDNKKDTYTPDWNNPYFLERAKALFNALSVRYKDDPRLGFVDVGLYGDFGEWHLWQFPNWNTKMTLANKKMLIESIYASFPNKRIFMHKDDSESLAYALGLSNFIGWRNDCLGNNWFSEGMDRVFSEHPWIADKWKTSLNITEFCNPPSMNLALSQISKYHVALVGNGNFGSLSSYSSTELENFKKINIGSGYRIALNTVSLPSNLSPNSEFYINSTWTNSGVNPAYHPWQVVYQFKNPSTGALVTELNSNFSLASFLPNPGSPVTVSENFILPNIASTSYDLFVVVKDSENYYQPMNLAITGRLSDGSYKLGRINVGSSSTPTPTPTQTFQATNTPTPIPLTTNDTTGPVINITSPVAGTVVTAKNQKVNIRSNSSDASGIYQTEIYFDNSSKPVKTCSSSSTCDTTIGKVSNGLHYIRVRSTDNSSNKNWSEVSISFSFSRQSFYP